MIEIRKLSKSFESDLLFSDISLKVNDGEVLGIIGPSGTGKSILLRSMMLLEKPDKGQIFLDDMEITSPDADIDKVHEKIGMVFQDYNLFNHLSVIENVMCGMIHIQKINPLEAYKEAMDLLCQVGLSEKAYSYPRTLSGGQKQRVAIARTLAMKPSIILMDEPTSALDQTMRGEVESVIELMKRNGHTIIIVSHEMEFIRSIATRICFISGGKIVEEGTPSEIFDHPKKEETRHFVKALRVLDIDIESKTFDFIGMETTIEEFAERNGVPVSLKEKIKSVMEEFCQMVIITPKEENHLKCLFEYDHHTQAINADIYFNGEEFDPDNPSYFLSWPIILKRISSFSIKKDDQSGFTNHLLIEIQ